MKMCRKNWGSGGRSSQSCSWKMHTRLRERSLLTRCRKWKWVRGWTDNGSSWGLSGCPTTRICAGKVASVRDNEHLSLLARPYSPFLYSIPHPKPHDHIRCLFLVYGVSILSRPAPVTFCLDSFVLAIRSCFVLFSLKWQENSLGFSLY